MPIGLEITGPANQRLADERWRRKIGLLTRILHDKDDGDLYRDMVGIEANFRVGGSRTIMYFYNTENYGRRTVEATPEEIRAVLGHRHAKQKAA